MQTILLEFPENLILVRNSNAMEISRLSDVVLFYRNSRKFCPIHHWTFLEIQTRFFWLNGRCPWLHCRFLLFCSCSDCIDSEPRCCAGQLCILLQIQVPSITGKSSWTIQIRCVTVLISLQFYLLLVYTTQVNSTFRTCWLASSEVISPVLYTSKQPKKPKMAFVSILSQIKFSLGR